ncbi:hypothetical protein [Oceanobacter mangrovi]|uniref:hypothetical protein n=1 Tax=Oceanobacter mangrovi TaxID=2862510 RepID=UPI001C8ECE1F|nr:hypothetical protein [Oceanobacter mangrovi]
MSQGLFNALFTGPKNPEGARKVTKFVAIYGFITVTLGVAIFFIPYEPLQSAIGERQGDKWMAIVLGLISLMFFYFLLKEKVWAAVALLAVETADVAVGYMESGNFFDSFSGVVFFLYASALQSALYLRKQNKSLDVDIGSRA